MQKKYAKMNLRGGYYKSAFIVRLFAALLLCAVLFCGTFLLFDKENNSAKALTDTSQAYQVGEKQDGTELSELWNSAGGYFNKYVLDDLMAKATGNTSADINSVKSYVDQNFEGFDNYNSSLTTAVTLQKGFEQFGSKVVTSRTINANAGNATYGMAVKLYGEDWQVTSLTIDNDGNVVATLWLTQPASKQKFHNTSVAGGTGATSYSSAQYSTSILRNTTLLNLYPNFYSGDWASAYLVTPEKIKYQETQNLNVNPYDCFDDASFEFDWQTEPNEAWGTPDNAKWNTTTSWHPQYIYNKANHGDWKYDYIWLPSITETGLKTELNRKTGFTNGIWVLTNEQRSFAGALTDTCWTRSSNGDKSIEYIRSDGYNAGGAPNVAQWIRPAIHFNLTAAAANAYYSEEDPADVTIEYDGEDHVFDNFAVTPPAWYNSNAETVTYSKSALIDAGSYTVTVSLNSGYAFKSSAGSVRNKTINYTVQKKKIGMLAPSVTDDGDLASGAKIEPNVSGIPYVHDIGKDTAPDFALQYRKAGSNNWSANKPTVAGSYFVRPYITNASTSNYEIDYSANNCETAFTKNKQSIAVPWFTDTPLASSAPANSITTVEYSGDWQEFDLINDGSAGTLTGVTAGARSNGLQQGSSPTKFKARDVGTYTLTVYLADSGANTRWEDFTNTATTRTITLEIKKKELAVTFDDDTVTSWQMGTRTDVKIKAGGVIAGESPQLHVYYTKTKGSVTDAPVDVPSSAIILNGTEIDVTVDLTQFEADCSYNLVVELASNVAANDNYMISTASASSFSFFILKAKITSLTIQWQYNNVNTGIQEVNAAGTQVEYNGQPFTFALDETKLPTGVLVNYTGEYTATDVKADGAMYTATVTISADNGYELDASLATTYTVTYQIKPLLFDLSKLEWTEDPEYSVTSVEMKLKNPPAWLTVTKGSASTLGFAPTNSETKVSTGGTGYTAGYVLVCDKNHAFSGWTGANAGLNQDGVKLMNNDTTAIVSHVWNIKPKQIKTSALDSDWAASETYQDGTEEHNSFEVPIANVAADGSEFKNVLEVKYYDDFSCDPSHEISLTDIVATPGVQKDYYIKLTVKDAPETTGNYQLYDTMFGIPVTEIVKEFSVGDIRPAVPVTFGPKEYVYNGKAQGQAPTISMQAAIRFEIWQIKDGTETQIGSGAADFPTAAGKYRIAVYFDEADPDDPNSLKNNYRLSPASYIYEIKPLTLLTDGWTAGEGNGAPVEKVIADTDYLDGTDFTALYEYHIYKVLADGSYDTVPADKTNLEYETKYVAVLTVNPDFADNVIFEPTAQTEFEFSTGFDPSNVLITIPEPVFSATKLPFSDSMQTFTVTNWDEIKDYVAAVEADGAEVPATGTFEMLAVGVMNVKFILRTDKNVSWENTGSIPLEFTLEITVREIELPAFGAVEFTGAVQDIFRYLPADYYGWVEVSLVGYQPFVAGTASKDENGNIVLYRAGEYTVKFHLIDSANTRWKQAPASGASHIAALGCVSPLASAATDDFTLALQVKKAVISGEWKDGKFIPADPALEGKYTVKYTDEDGNEVEFGAFEDGKKYRAVAALNGDCANDYEFGAEICEPNDPATTATEFEQTASFADKTLGFLKRYWIWLVISVCALAFAVFAVVYLAKRPSRAAVAAYEEELSEEAEELAQEEEEEEEPAPEEAPVVTADAQPTAAEPAVSVAAKSAEKDGLSDKLDELTAAMKEALASKGSEHSPAPAPYAYPPAYPYAPPAPAVVYAAQPAAAAGPVAAAPVATVSPAASVPAAAPVPADVGAGSLGIGGLPLGLDTALNETSAALGVMGLADEAALHADTDALGLMGGAAVKKNSADALGKLGEPDADEELEEEPKKKKRRIVVRSEDDYEEVAIPQTAKANASVPSAAAPVQQPNADAQQAAAQQPGAAMGTNGMNPVFNGMMMNGMNPMMNGMGMNGMNPMMNGMGMNGMNPMMNGMGMNGMNPMMNGMGMNGMNPMMNGMGMNPMMFGMGQPLIIPVPVDMGGSDEDTETRVVYED